MMEHDIPKWLDWAREIQAISQTGLTFSQNDYDTQRYQRLGEIATEITSEHSNLEKAELLKNFMTQPGYATPKVDVRGAVLQHDKILLVQEKIDKGWCMPGGWADVGETPSECVAREFYEESGFHVKPKKIIGIFDANRDGRPLEFYHAYKIIFLCEILGGAPTPSNETLAVDFFDFDHLPPFSHNRTNEKHISVIQAFIEQKSIGCVFD